MPTSEKNHPYSGGVFALEIEEGGKNFPIGFINSVDGGSFKSTAVKQQIGADPLTHYFAGAPMYDDITFSIGMSTSMPFWNWIRDCLQHKPSRRSGAIVHYDFRRRERSRRTFSQAVLSEVTFPALDASSKSTAQMTVKISPENITYTPEMSDTQAAVFAQNEMKKQKQWIPSAFRVDIDRFSGDESLARHSKVDSFTVKQNVIVRHIGAFPEALKEGGRIEFPQIAISFPSSYAKPWMQWWDDTVHKGNHFVTTTGALTYLGANMSTELMRLSLDGVGLLSLEPVKLEAGKDGVHMMKATVYVTSMELQQGAGAAGS